MTADDLWNKHFRLRGGKPCVGYKDLLAALAERDEYVKKECARVCQKLAENDFYEESSGLTCAAAIERMEIK